MFVANLQVQTSEPAGGFTGACLLDRPYGTTLPTVLWSYARGGMSKEGETALDVIAYSAHIACQIVACQVNSGWRFSSMICGDSPAIRSIPLRCSSRRR